MLRVNKYNIHWQIVRVKARKQKDVDAKIKFVLHFLNSNKNIHNYGRVYNWLKMTSIAYKGEKRKKFEDAAVKIHANKAEYSSTQDMDNDLSKISREDLEMVKKDLETRKYDFQYGTTPKAHKDFMNKIRSELERRYIY